VYYRCRIRGRPADAIGSPQSAGALPAVSSRTKGASESLGLAARLRGDLASTIAGWQARITVTRVDHNAVTSDRSNLLLLGRPMKGRQNGRVSLLCRPKIGGRRNFWCYCANAPAEVYFAPLPIQLHSSNCFPVVISVAPTMLGNATLHPG
jgi:hypothetical protein